jgi:nitrogen regulatory protein PII
MKLILAIIRPEKLEVTKDALVACGIIGKQLGHREVYRGVEMQARLLAKVMLTLLVVDELVAEVKAVIRESAMTGEIGDGKIIVLAVEDAMRIRTGESGVASLA